MKLNKINIRFGTAKNPQSQANVERFHSTLLEHLRCLDEGGERSSLSRMKLAIIAYNNSISSATGLTPNEIVFGHTKLRNPLDLYYDETFYQNQTQQHKERMKILYERIKQKDQTRKTKTQEKQKEKVKQTEWKIDEMVYVKNLTKSNKLQKPYFGPYKILTVFDNDTVEVETKRGIQRYHTRYLKHGIVPDASSPPSPPISD